MDLLGSAKQGHSGTGGTQEVSGIIVVFGISGVLTAHK